jgi:hypothetical protein
MCGCPRRCKRSLNGAGDDRVRSCVRPRSAALSHAAGRYGDTQTRRRSKTRALSSLTLIAFPGLDLSDQFALTVPRPPSSPTHQRKRLADQAGASADPRYSSPLLSIAQADRAILLARAMATTNRGLWASIRASHDPLAAPLRTAHLTTAMAPMIRTGGCRAAPSLTYVPASASHPSCVAEGRDRARQQSRGLA